MAKDMVPGEVREHNGKNYKYVEQYVFESDMNWIFTCCKGCAFNKVDCIHDISNDHKLGNCHEEHREDGRNGIFVEVENE